MFINISTYLFTPLSGLDDLREMLRRTCRQGELKGTIILSPEGINVFVSGTRGSIDDLRSELRNIPGLEGLRPKESMSQSQPFRRMLVKIKKEIIAFGIEGINPGRRTSQKLPPRLLKEWIDSGQPLTLLDTRNDYEIRMGTFHGAMAVGVSHFRNFPEAVAKLPQHLKQQPIVMFCTGGIRCEKAGPYMESVGFENVFQLDGGILNYFQECGGDHYDGECFMFDRRVGVDSQLHETLSVLCFACQMPLTQQEQGDRRYQEGVCCPFCHGRRTKAQEEDSASGEESSRELISRRPKSEGPRDF